MGEREPGEGGGGELFITKAQHFYSGQYGSNDLPRPRRSALSECFYVVCFWYQ